MALRELAADAELERARLPVRGDRAAAPVPRLEPRAAARDRSDQARRRRAGLPPLPPGRRDVDDPADLPGPGRQRVVRPGADRRLDPRAGRAVQPRRHLRLADRGRPRRPRPPRCRPTSWRARRSSTDEVDDWQAELPPPQQETLAAQRLWQLADAYRAQLSTAQAQHLREFASNAEEVLRRTGDLVLLDEPEDILVLRADGRFETSLDLSDRPEDVVTRSSRDARADGHRSAHDRRVLRPRRRPALGHRGARRALSRGRLLRRLRMTDASLREHRSSRCSPMPAPCSRATSS